MESGFYIEQLLPLIWHLDLGKWESHFFIRNVKCFAMVKEEDLDWPHMSMYVCSAHSIVCHRSCTNLKKDLVIALLLLTNIHLLKLLQERLWVFFCSKLHYFSVQSFYLNPWYKLIFKVYFGSCFSAFLKTFWYLY